MKSLLLTLLLSASAFAYEGPQDALKSVLNLGTYYGHGCSVTLTQTSEGVLVVGRNAERTVEYLVPKTGAYRVHAGQNYFLSSLNKEDVFTSFMTRATDNGQYFAVEKITSFNRENYKSLVECETL